MSFKGQSYSDNPRAIFETLKEDAKYKDYQFIWAFKDNRELPGAVTVKFNSFKYYIALSKAKYWVFNSKMASFYNKRANQVYLQTWHGTPLKKLAHDIIDDNKYYYRSHQSYKQMVEDYDKDSKHWDFLISPNTYSSEVFSSAFRFPTNKMIETGYPRVDKLVNSTFEQVQQLKDTYELPKDKKIILYAPTWRDDSFKTSGYIFEMAADFYNWKKKLGDEYIILFKPHYLISNVYSVPEDLKNYVFVLANDVDINSIYRMADLLITDYSSVFFDYAALERPIYFYMYDFDKYEQELRGFYLNIPEDLPNSIAKNENDLLEMIKNNDFSFERLREFNRKFNLWNDGESSRKVIRRVFSES